MEEYGPAAPFRFGAALAGLTVMLMLRLRAATQVVKA
jgi:hypothetical protein